jgi:hypothetical protein
MRFVVLAGLLSLAAAVPVEEKRQTDVAVSLPFPSPPAGFTPGAFPPEDARFRSIVLTGADCTPRKLHRDLRETNWLVDHLTL